MQDAQAHHRWHPLGDGYRPQPGDWVLFDGHVEVVTSYSPGALRTVGGDSRRTCRSTRTRSRLAGRRRA